MCGYFQISEEKSCELRYKLIEFEFRICADDDRAVDIDGHWRSVAGAATAAATAAAAADDDDAYTVVKIIITSNKRRHMANKIKTRDLLKHRRRHLLALCSCQL